MSSSPFPVVGISVSVALAACAAGICSMVSASEATSRCSRPGKKLRPMGATP
jgi:hypothetical protein